MATIYKRKQDRGKRRACWYIGYVDHSGKRRTRKGYSDKAETQRLAAKLEEEARMIRDGIGRTQSGTSVDTRLEYLIAEFEDHLRNRDVSPKQVGEVSAKVRRVFNGCGFSELRDIEADDVERQLAELRSEGMSKQTSNHYLRAIKQFCRWLVRTKRSSEDVMANVPMLNVQTDRRHDRRPLLPEEFALLVRAAVAGDPMATIVGGDRAMMYILSAWTGYRKGEIGSLTLRSFDLDGDPPTVTVEAAYSKRKRRDTQALHPDVVERLKNWLATKSSVKPDVLLFPVSAKVPGGVERRTSQMMRAPRARPCWLRPRR